MTPQEFASDAWLLEGMTVSIPGWLVYQKERLSFSTPDEVVFDVPRAAGTPYRLSFVKPNGVEYAVGRGLGALGSPLALLVAASKVSDVRAGRDLGRRWRELLS